MKRRGVLAVVCAVLVGSVSGPASATLYSVSSGGDRMVYDSDLDITWIADGNYSGSPMNWADANTWAAGLSYGGYKSGWRLPTTAEPDATCSNDFLGQATGTGCENSELGHLYSVELGRVANQSVLTSPDVTSAATDPSELFLFFNVQTDTYWSSTQPTANPLGAFDFDMGNGDQGVTLAGVGSFYAWAVRDGGSELLNPAVPLPGTPWLFGIGLASLFRWRNRRRAA